MGEPYTGEERRRNGHERRTAPPPRKGWFSWLTPARAAGAILVGVALGAFAAGAYSRELAGMPDLIKAVAARQDTLSARQGNTMRFLAGSSCLERQKLDASLDVQTCMRRLLVDLRDVP